MYHVSGYLTYLADMVCKIGIVELFSTCKPIVKCFNWKVVWQFLGLFIQLANVDDQLKFIGNIMKAHTCQSVTLPMPCILRAYLYFTYLVEDNVMTITHLHKIKVHLRQFRNILNNCGATWNMTGSKIWMAENTPAWVETCIKMT